eukprot:SAG31_NODE_33026_length_348_cov_9.261044_1_plen_75_part_00
MAVLASRDRRLPAGIGILRLTYFAADLHKQLSLYHFINTSLLFSSNSDDLPSIDRSPLSLLLYYVDAGALEGRS